MGAPIIPIRLHNLKIFGCEPSLDFAFLFKKYKTNGEIIHPIGAPKVPPSIARR